MGKLRQEKRHRKRKWAVGLAPSPPHPHLIGPDVSQHEGAHQDEHGWPPVNTTSRPWRSAPPSPPPPGTRHTGTLTHPGSSLTLVPPSFPIPPPPDSPLHPLRSYSKSPCTTAPPICPLLWVSESHPFSPQPWGPARPPCSPCRLSSFWIWWLRPSPAA